MSKVLPIAESALFDHFENKVPITLDYSDWKLKTPREEIAAMTVGVRLYAFAIMVRLHLKALRTVPNGNNRPKAYNKASRAIVESDPLAKRLQERYTASVTQLLSLPLSSPAERRLAFVVRKNLRNGVQLLSTEANPYSYYGRGYSNTSAGANAAPWLKELFDAPLKQQERLLKFEFTSANN